MAGSKPAPAWSNKYDPVLTKQIINSQHILHVSFLTKDSEYPSVCYLVGKILQYKNNPEALYVHGHIQEPVKGRFEIGQEEGDPSLSVSIAASTINSHYLGFSGFATAFTFANTVLNGTATLMEVSDKVSEEREWVMAQIANSDITDRWSHLRPAGTDLNWVSMIKIIPNAQKSHTHSVPEVLGFEFQEDAENPPTCKDPWEGAIPIWQKLGDPISGPHNKNGGRKAAAPQWVTDFIKTENAKNEKLSTQMAGSDYPYALPKRGH